MHKKLKDHHLATQSWNKKEEKKPWLLYILISIFCFAIAWVMN